MMGQHGQESTNNKIIRISHLLKATGLAYKIELLIKQDPVHKGLWFAGGVTVL